MTYQMVTAQRIEKLVSAIQANLDLGWVLYGDTHYWNGQYYQAMTKDGGGVGQQKNETESDDR